MVEESDASGYGMLVLVGYSFTSVILVSAQYPIEVAAANTRLVDPVKFSS